MILGLQIVAIIFSLSIVYFATLHYRRGEIEKAELVVWITIWAGTIFVVVFPNFLRGLASRFFITRLFDLLVVGGFVLVISMVTRVYVSTKKMEKKLEDLIRKDALIDVKVKKYDKNKK